MTWLKREAAGLKEAKCIITMDVMYDPKEIGDISSWLDTMLPELLPELAPANIVVETHSWQGEKDTF